MTDNKADNKLELYKRYRPTKFSEVRGQPDAIRMLIEMGRKGKIPHCILLTGPSGTGKTTIARILKDKLHCVGEDWAESNLADVRGIDGMRAIADKLEYLPMQGECRIFYLDECGAATGEAQDCCLKMMEDTPEHVYFILATTAPENLIDTIKTRSTIIQLKALSAKDIAELVEDISQKEFFKLDIELRDKIVEVADGSARRALVLLNQAIVLPDLTSQLAVVTAGETSVEVIQLCRLIFNDRMTWKAVSTMLKTIQDEPEKVRRSVLGYAASVLLNSGKPRAYDVILAFERNWYDGGKASMAASCYECCGPSKSDNKGKEKN
jgi:DNA polymerase III gamma/tau subunit